MSGAAGDRPERAGPIDGSALVFLDAPEAMKLAAAWPYCVERDDGAWAECAGVRTDDAKRLGRPLRLSGVCRDDGTTDPLALKYIAAKMTAWKKPARSNA